MVVQDGSAVVLAGVSAPYLALILSREKPSPVAAVVDEKGKTAPCIKVERGLAHGFTANLFWQTRVGRPPSVDMPA